MDYELLLTQAASALEELITDQEISVRSEYNWPNVPPAMQKKFEIDMASVEDAKIVLSKIRQVVK